MQALPPPPPAFVQTYAFVGKGMCEFHYRPRRMTTNFDKAFAAIVGLEGGYVNDPKDPGGETKFGISKRSYPKEDIKAITLDRAREIYRKDFWTAIHGDELTWPLSLFLFDAAVNQGPEVAVSLLQKSVGVAQDGSMGPRTIKAAVAGKQTETCALFMADRALRYTGTRNFDLYGRGWLARLFRVVINQT